MKLPKNIGKVLTCLLIELGNFVPFSILASFSSQIYLQLDLNKLGIIILMVSSFSAIFSALAGSTFLTKFSLKATIVLSSLGISLWIIGYIFPIACVNLGYLNKGFCTKTAIMIIILFLTFIGGAAFTINTMAIFIFTVHWSSQQDMALFQGLIYSFFLIGKVLSSIVFAFTMKSKQAQLFFFIGISVCSLLATFLFNFLSMPKQNNMDSLIINPSEFSESQISPKSVPEISESLMVSTVNEPAFFPKIFESVKSTLKLAFSPKMLLIVPYNFYVTFIRNMKLAILPIMYNYILKAKHDRFYINQMTGYIGICDSICAIIWGTFIGILAKFIPKKIIAFLSIMLGLVNCGFILMLFYYKKTFGPEWFLAAIYLACSLSTGVIVQTSIMGTDFKEKEKAIGASDFWDSLCSVIIYMIFASTEITDFKFVALILVLDSIISIICFARIKLK